MTFTKTSNETWESNQKDTNYYIDLLISKEGYKTYYLTITRKDKTILNDINFFKLNEAKKYAKQY